MQIRDIVTLVHKIKTYQLYQEYCFFVLYTVLYSNIKALFEVGASKVFKQKVIGITWYMTVAPLNSHQIINLDQVLKYNSFVYRNLYKISSILNSFVIAYLMH